MDKPLPKYGGITIERVSKGVQKADPVTTSHRNHSVPLPSGISLQEPALNRLKSQPQNFPQVVSGQNYFDEEVDDASEFQEEEYDGGEWGNDLHGSGFIAATSSSTGKSPIMLSSEEDAVDSKYDSEDALQQDTSDEAMEDDNIMNSHDTSPKPMLPPGITFQRKNVTLPMTATVKPNIQLPPGISLGKRPGASTAAVAPQIVNPPPDKGSLRNVRPPRSSTPQKQLFPGLNFPPQMKTVPPVRAVRPRAKIEPPRMMINEFLEQRMKIGGNAFLGPPTQQHRGVQRTPGVRATRAPKQAFPFDNTLFPKVGQARPRNRAPTFGSIRPPAPLPRYPSPIVPLPHHSARAPPPPPRNARASVQSESDPEDDLPLMPKKTDLSALKLPPGINLERKRIDRLEIEQPPTGPDSAAKNMISNPKLPTNIKLPAGISLERKVPSTQQPTSQVKAADGGSGKATLANLKDLEHEDFEEEVLGDITDNALAEQNATRVASKALADSLLHTLKKNESNVKSMPGIQLPPGISFGKQTFDGASHFSEAVNEYKSADEGEEHYTGTEADQEYHASLSGENEEAEENDDAFNEDMPTDEPSSDLIASDQQAEAENNAEMDADDYNDEYENGDEDNHETEAPVREDIMDEHPDEYAEPTSLELPNEGENEGDGAEEAEEGAVDAREEAASEVEEAAYDADGDECENALMEADGDGAEAEPGAEIDFETLIAAPMIPTVNAISQPSGSDVASEQTQEELDGKEDLRNLMEMMSKGEIEGEIEEDDEEKKGEKRKAEGDGEGENDEGGAGKRSKHEDEEGNESEGDGGNVDTSKVSSTHLRKNIREVMDETKLDETTLAAQRQEAERLKRLQEQQRILREVKRQIQLSKNAEKSQNQSHVLTLLRGNSETSILKKSSGSAGGSVSSAAGRSQDSILLKMGNGQQTCLSDKMRELLKTPGRPATPQHATRNLLNKGMLSSSVTIAAVRKEQYDDEGRQKKGDVVTLSSDSDDCVVLSEEEAESEPDDDPTNSGMHTSDKYNIPDEQGQVLVNVGHPADETDVFLAPQIARIIKPHQIGGVRFLYDNIIESADRFASSDGFGCILAHSMGLGKTLQIVSFSDIFLRHTAGKKILCIMPINTIQNWQAEFNMWLPRENPTEDAQIRCREFNVYVVNESSKNIHTRGKVILEWDKNGGVLLMGYELFRLLSLKKPIRSKRKRPDDAEEEKNRNLVEDVYAALVKPGPDLVICDEGHRIKNSHATTSQALKQIRTKRRIVLTGYPLQNNLLEYWCMVDFVRPNYLGSKTEFSNMFERPIQNGQCIDSTPQDKRLMRYRAHVLHSLLEGFVQRRSHSVLQNVLPHKQEYVLLLRFTPFQSKLYSTFMNEVVRTVAVPNPLKAFAVCCKIWNHPDVLFHFLKKKGQQRDLDLEDALPLVPLGMPPYLGDGMGLGLNPQQPPPPPNPNPNNWPKKGPGSRGGKVRQKKGLRGAQKDASEPLPSMNQFQASPSQSAVGYSAGSTSGINYSQNQPYQQQGSLYNSQQQQQQYPQTDLGFQGSYSGSDPLYKPYEDEKQFKNSQFGSNYSHNQFSEQYSQSGSMSNNSADQQYYPQSNQGYEYNQNGEVGGEFGQVGGYSDSGYSNNTFCSDYQQPQNPAWGSNWGGGGSQGGYSSSSDEFMSPPKFPNFEEKKEACDFGTSFPTATTETNPNADPSPLSTGFSDKKLGSARKPKGELEDKKEDKTETKKDEISFEWATELFKNYVSGLVENSSKMEAFMLIVTESISRGDRMLVFSQSLLTLDLIEDYFQKRLVPGREEAWAKNRNYFRLDGSTPALEREKLINEFNSNEQVQVFLVSTRAGSLGINLVGANRVVVFDASWNPCHDTQAVCRVYRYGQQKPCFVYRLVMDCCLEKKIYDRQINKQGMADRIVDELNPDAHLSLKDVTNLCWDDQEETKVTDFADLQHKYHDDIVKLLLSKHSTLFSRPPFQHESLLIDRKEKKLSQAEKRLAKRSYELEKQAATNPRGIYQLFPNASGRGSKPIASVKPMQSGVYGGYGGMPPRSKWIPADVWQKQGMSAQEMTLPLDVVIPTNSPDKTSIVLKAGQRVMVLKSPKGIYMQLETGKIIAIKTAFKVGATAAADKTDDKKPNAIASALKNNPNVTITKSSAVQRGTKLPAFFKPAPQSLLDKKAAAINMAASKGRVAFNNKNRVIPGKKPAIVTAALGKKVQAKAMDTSAAEDRSPVPEAADKTAEIDIAPSESRSERPLIPELGENERVPSDPYVAEPSNHPMSQNPGPSSIVDDAAPMWGSENAALEDQDIAKERLDNLNAMTEESPMNEPVAGNASEDTSAFQPPMSSESKESQDVKKAVDATSAWPQTPQAGYSMDPYGNYYPGYPGYYGPPMPGYDPYRGYPSIPPLKAEVGVEAAAASGQPRHPAPPPPMPGFDPYRAYPAPVPPIKAEASEGTPPPSLPTAPHMYPPYHAPYPYPYNYPPFPPQGQHTAPSAQHPASVKAEAGDSSAFVPPPYAPRPPYPTPAPAPGFYPNYPPYPRPYHDPNYPYPNYPNPYMPPPAGYGYPMQSAPFVNKPPSSENGSSAPDGSHTQ